MTTPTNWEQPFIAADLEYASTHAGDFVRYAKKLFGEGSFQPFALAAAAAIAREAFGNRVVYPEWRGAVAWNVAGNAHAAVLRGNYTSAGWEAAYSSYFSDPLLQAAVANDTARAARIKQSEEM